MATIAEALAAAVQHHQAGNLAHAEVIYRRILQAEPNHPDALHLLGVLAYQAGRLDLAVPYIRQAIALNPRDAAYHSNLGMVYLVQGQWDAAVASYRQALNLNPTSADASYNLGSAWQAQGRLQEAEGCYRDALRLRPSYPEAHNNLAVVLRARGRPQEAEACCREALRWRPGYPDAQLNLADALQDQGRLDEAEACFHTALPLKPDYPEAHNGLGCLLHRLGRLGEAEACFREALRLRPGYAAAHNNLGAALQDQGRLPEAEVCFRNALHLNPGYLEARSNLGVLLQELGRLPEAEACFQEAIRVEPDHATAHVNHSLLRLLRSDWAGGWPEYEWRWKLPGSLRRPSARPEWDGSPLAGRTILLYGEQGLGDTLQFVRYAPLVKQRGGTVLLECQPSLLPLLRSCPGVDRLLAQGSPLPAFDVQASVVSLPGILGTTPDHVPADVPYLSADPALTERWRGELTGEGFKVGIAWQGDPIHKRDRRRSVPLARFAPLAAVPGVRLFSLQKGPGSEQLAGAGFQVTDLGRRLQDWGDTAAVLKSLDLLVSVDTAVVHCAGALGVSAWVLLAFSPDWRWLLGREDNPWYPTLRLFRQQQPGDWDDVFRRVAEALRESAAAGGAG